MAKPTEALVRSPATNRRFVRPLVLTLALAALVALALLGYQGWRAYSAAQALYGDVKALQAIGGEAPGDAVAAAGPLLARARADALTLRAEAGPLLPLTSRLGWMPIYGQDLASAEQLVDFAVELTAAADELVAAAAPLAPALEHAEALDPALVQRLAAAQPRLSTAREAAARAGALWVSVRPGLTPATHERLRPAGALAPLLESVAGLGLAAGRASPALSPLGAGGTSPASLVAGLAGARPDLAAAGEDLARAREAWTRVPREALPSGLRPRLDQLGALLTRARDAVELALVIPPLLGADGPRQYLLIAQNPDEVRATGGFMSSSGVLTFDGGRPRLSDLRDTAFHDDYANSVYPEPPAPMLRYMNIEMWLFRDANWSPDFPTAARTIRELYELGGGRAISDVIAFDPAALQLILDATGPLTVTNSPTPVTAANLRQYMLAQYDLKWGTSSESFIGELSTALLDRVGSGSADLDLAALGRAVWRALDERHLLIAVTDPAAAAVLARHGWDGAVQPGDHDFLMVVDSNIGYDKVTSNVDERVRYTVDLSDPRAPTATVSVTYTHMLSGPETCAELDERILADRAYETWMVSCYQDYLRILIPGASTLLEAPARRIPAEWTWHGRPDQGLIAARPGEAGTTALGVYLAVPLGGTHETYARYALPATVLSEKAGVWSYTLVVQKQPARGQVPYTVSVRLPAGATLVAATPQPAREEDGALVFAVDRAAGETIEVDFTLK